MKRLLKRWKAQRGSQTVAFVLLVPALVIVLGTLWIAGRYANADTGVQAAANAAARDASLARTAAGARSAGTAAAERVLSQYSTVCINKSISIDTTGFAAPLGQTGTVKARISCTIANDAAIAPGFPGTKTFDQAGVSPIDRYRER